MKYKITFQSLFITILCSVIITLPVYSVDITVGFLTSGDELHEVEEAAYNWADDNYQTTRLIANDNGTFKNNAGTALKLDQYAVLWLLHTKSNKIPDALLSDGTKKAILDYIESGGGIFLSAVGLRYVVDLGVEKGGNPRVFQPLGKGPPPIGVKPTDEAKNHPIFKGFDTSAPIFLTSMDQGGFTSDFHNFAAKDPTGTILGTKTRGGGGGAGERPLVEYDVQDGIIITLGHHNGVYTDSKSKESDNLRMLTKNILNYLADNSAYLSVQLNGKLTTTWGRLKSTLE
ncbi:hypothetical protein C6497_07265 [Candidatus Poribacteria bacterium]|nr:MAG: hypothetical protein C6497_07265 [Candidatus Poribacteria bacterium]